MKIANQETINDITFTALFEGKNERYLIVVSQTSEGEIEEMFIRDTLNILYTEGTEEEKEAMKDYLSQQKLKNIFHRTVFSYTGMNVYSVFQDIKHFTILSNEIYEEVSLFIEQNQFQTKKNGLNEDLILFSKEVRTRSKDLMEMNDFFYNALFTNILKEVETI